MFMYSYLTFNFVFDDKFCKSLFLVVKKLFIYVLNIEQFQIL